MKKFCAVFILLLLTAAGCNKENVKPSADSLLTTAAFNSINRIKESYEARNRGELQSSLSAEAAGGILKNLFFEKAELSFTPRLVRITGTSVIVNLNWQGVWWIVKDKKIENRGVVNLILDKETMKLIRIDGDNPFQIPIAE